MITKILLTLSAVLIALSVDSEAQISMAFSTIGNPGNANDKTQYGGVNYNYAIGTYDVTVSQYCAFLNAVAARDTYSLYNPSMASDTATASITRSGVAGSYRYSVIPGTDNNPITYVSWFDAARFTNWLCNGQPTGAEGNRTTETGAYTLNGIMSGGLSISRNVNAQYWIPSENEWYKAAYFDPSLNGGSGGYWNYPTMSNTAPGASWANRDSANMANTWTGVSLTGSSNCLTPVGSFTNSASAYGTYDQGGNVWQLNDTVFSGSYRVVRGSIWDGGAFIMQSSHQSYIDPSTETNDVGFRVATVLPYQIWGASVFALSQLANSAISGDLAAPAGDGISNLIKYALHLNPFVNGVSGLPTESIVTLSGTIYPALAYTKVIAATDLTYTVQVSSDLQTWNSGASYTATVSATNNPDGVTQSVTIRSLASISEGSPQQFIRLQISH